MKPMDEIQQRIQICGAAERDKLQSRQVTHLLTIGNPRANFKTSLV